MARKLMQPNTNILQWTFHFSKPFKTCWLIVWSSRRFHFSAAEMHNIMLTGVSIILSTPFMSVRWGGGACITEASFYMIHQSLTTPLVEAQSSLHHSLNVWFWFGHTKPLATADRWIVHIKWSLKRLNVHPEYRERSCQHGPKRSFI